MTEVWLVWRRAVAYGNVQVQRPVSYRFHGGIEPDEPRMETVNQPVPVQTEDLLMVCDHDPLPLWPREKCYGLRSEKVEVVPYADMHPGAGI